MPGTAVVLGEHPATPGEIRAIAAGAPVVLAGAGLARMTAARAVVEAAAARGEAVYGLTRRLGAGSGEPVDAADAAQHAFQRQVLANHLGGAGSALPPVQARALVAARLAVLLGGGSTASPAVAVAAAALLADDAVPPIPSLGSVGEADLVQLAAVLDALVARGLVLRAGDAAGFLGQNALSTGVGALASARLAELAETADRAAADSLLALAAAGAGGSPAPFVPAAVAAAPGPGHGRSAARILARYEAGAAVPRADAPAGTAPAADPPLQDPLAFRTAAHLHGALLGTADRLEALVAQELAARPENPLVDAASGRILPTGNFAAIETALAVDAARLALAHVAAASERRTARLSELLRPARRAGASELPGLSWYAAADALAELRQLAVPVSLGATPLSGVEDTATFAPLGLRQLDRAAELLELVLGVESAHAAELVRLSARP